MSEATVVVNDWVVIVTGCQPGSRAWFGDDQPETVADDGSVEHDYAHAGRPRWPRGAPPAPGRRHLHYVAADGTAVRTVVDIQTGGVQSAR